MRVLIYGLIVSGVLIGLSPHLLRAESIDGRVVQMHLPNQDITLSYVERKGGFTVELQTKSASIEGQKFFVGDGKVAVMLVAHSTDGIFLQGDRLLHGAKIKAGSTIKVKPGYKNAANLSAGDVYVKLLGVQFELPSE